MATVLKNCRLIPVLSGGLIYKLADVTISEGKIRAIVPAGEGKNDGDVLDCGGKTLMPGMIDLHIHLCTAGCGLGIDYAGDFDLMIKGCKNAKKYLDFGYTTIRDMGSTNRVSHAVRDAVNSGIFIGPRIIGGGKMILPSGYLEYDKVNNAYSSVTGSNEMMKAVREEIGMNGADVVKIYASGSGYYAGGAPAQPILIPEEVRAAVFVATMKGRKVAAHCHSAEAINMCIDEGVYTIEHGTYIDDVGIDKLKKETSYLVPTLTVFHHIKGSIKDPVEDERMEKVKESFANDASVHIRAAYEAGLKLGYGTDMTDGEWDKRIGMEFKMRSEICGMSNTDMLLQATKYSAMIAGLEGITGEVREGLAADLILVDGKPDINIESMYKKPEMVFMGGVRVR